MKNSGRKNVPIATGRFTTELPDTMPDKPGTNPTTWWFENESGTVQLFSTIVQHKANRMVSSDNRSIEAR